MEHGSWLPAGVSFISSSYACLGKEKPMLRSWQSCSQGIRPLVTVQRHNAASQRHLEEQQQRGGRSSAALQGSWVGVGIPSRALAALRLGCNEPHRTASGRVLWHCRAAAHPRCRSRIMDAASSIQASSNVALTCGMLSLTAGPRFEMSAGLVAV